jgi:hypothetical protein
VTVSTNSEDEDEEEIEMMRTLMYEEAEEAVAANMMSMAGVLSPLLSPLEADVTFGTGKTIADFDEQEVGNNEDQNILLALILSCLSLHVY